MVVLELNNFELLKFFFSSSVEIKSRENIYFFQYINMVSTPIYSVLAIIYKK